MFQILYLFFLFAGVFHIILFVIVLLLWMVFQLAAFLLRPVRALQEAADWIISRETRYLALAAALVVALCCAPTFLTGGKLCCVTTGSMWPAIGLDDLTLTKPCSMEEVAVGDIINYRSGDIIISHRVIEKGTDSQGQPYLQMQGDANQDSDPEPVTSDMLHSKVVQVWHGLRPNIRAENGAVYFLGFRLDIADGWMWPDLGQGDLVLAKRCRIQDVEQGDKVVCWNLEERAEMETRVLSKEQGADGETFLLVGRNMMTGEEIPITERQLFGKVVKVWPGWADTLSGAQELLSELNLILFGIVLAVVAGVGAVESLHQCQDWIALYAIRRQPSKLRKKWMEEPEVSELQEKAQYVSNRLAALASEIGGDARTQRRRAQLFKQAEEYRDILEELVGQLEAEEEKTRQK